MRLHSYVSNCVAMIDKQEAIFVGYGLVPEERCHNQGKHREG